MRTLPIARLCRLAALLALVWGCAKPTGSDWAPVVEDQGLNESEEGAFEQAKDALLQLDAVHMVITLRDGIYEIHTRDGVTYFIRDRDRDGWTFEVLPESTGPNPVANQDPRALMTLEETFATGGDPNDMCEEYERAEPGYDCPDERVFFPTADALTYPRAYERIAALFDSPRAPDFVIEYQPYVITDIGTMVAGHGHLNVLASRAVLSFAGPGVRPRRIGSAPGTEDMPVPAAVDIAPTVAHLMGVEKRTGIDAAGRLSRDVYLAHQDGRVLSEVLDDSGDRPKRVFMISHDALMPVELDRLMDHHDLPAYRFFREQGAYYDYGVVSNWPTNTFASLNTICTGTWSGRHGLIDNAFFVRETRRHKSPITELVEFGRFVIDEVETLHQAIERSFPNWHPDGTAEQRIGNFTAALNNPCGKGADFALLELRETYDWNRCLLPEEIVTRYPLPPLDRSLPVNGQAVDNVALTDYLKLLFGRLPSGERCAPIPRFVFVNFGLTDDVAHYRGPHSDAQRRAMIQTDVRTSIMMEAARDAGIFDETLFVLLSDHGQVLVDRSRLPEPAAILDDLGLKYFANDQFTFVYLYTIDLEVDAPRLRAGREARIRLTARDDDRGFLLPDHAGEEDDHGEGAGETVGRVTVPETGRSVPVVGGQAEITVVPEGASLHLQVTHPDYSPRDLYLPVALER